MRVVSKLFNTLMVIVALFSACCIDSDSVIPMIALAICVVYFLIVVLAKRGVGYELS